MNYRANNHWAKKYKEKFNFLKINKLKESKNDWGL